MSDINNSGRVAFAPGDAGLLRRWFPTLVDIGPISLRGLKKGWQSCARKWRRIRPTVVVLLVVGAVLHISFNIYATVLLNRALAVIRGRGEPHSLPELNVQPRIADGQNAAVYYHKAYQLLKEPAKNLQGFKVDVSGYPLHQTVKKLARCKTAIALVRQATQLASCQFPTGFDIESWTRPEEDLWLKGLMSESAVWEAKHGDSANSMLDVSAIYTMSRRLADEPPPISYPWAQVVDATAYHTLAQVLEANPGIAPRARAMLTNFPAQNNVVGNLPRLLINMRREGIDNFEAVRANPSAWPLYYQSAYDQHSILSDYFCYNNEPPSRKILLAPLRILLLPITKKNDISGWVTSFNMVVRYADNMYTNKQSSIGDKPSPLVQLLYKSWTVANLPLGALWSPFWKMDEVAYISAMDKIELRTSRSGGEGNKLPKAAWSVEIGGENLSRLRLIVNRSAVSRKLADVAVAIAMYRTAQGHYPASLDEVAKISGPLPPDPDTGKGFIYRLQAPSYLLYGLGLNRRDDGGKREYWPVVKDDVCWGNQKTPWNAY